jgi:hypothetical protein
MEIYILGTAVLAFVAILAAISPMRVLSAAVVLTSFGMFAAFKLPIGDLTPLLSHAAAGLGAGVLALVGLQAALAGRSLSLPRGGEALLLMTIWGVVGAMLLPRLFAGEIEVFSWARDASGARVDPRFPALLSPLAPGSSNMSQSFYLALSTAFFFAMTASLRRHGAAPAITALRWAAAANVLLAILSVLAPHLLDPIRTASYALLDHHVVAGLPRVIGGFPEASGFGAHSATLAAFLIALGTSRDIFLGVLNAALAAASLSSTGLAGLTAASAALLVCAALARPQQEHAYVLAAALLATVCAALLVLPGMDLSGIVAIIDQLALSKADSASGLERGAMAVRGFEVLRESYGLGIGMGSTRANGYPSALAAALGIPGIVLFIAFLFGAFTSGAGAAVKNDYTARRAAGCAAFTALAVASISSFSVDPGILFMTCAAIASATAHRTTSVPAGAPSAATGPRSSA